MSNATPAYGFGAMTTPAISSPRERPDSQVVRLIVGANGAGKTTFVYGQTSRISRSVTSTRRGLSPCLLKTELGERQPIARPFPLPCSDQVSEPLTSFPRSRRAVAEGAPVIRA